MQNSASMNLNIDMSEIIEFVMPTKSEFAEQNNEEEDEETESNNHYVVLDAVDVGRDYKTEEFLLINDNDEDDGEGAEVEVEQLLLNSCPELRQYRVPKDEPFDLEEEGEEELQYTTDEQIEDLVEQEEGSMMMLMTTPTEPFEDEVDETEEDGHQSYEWNYAQTLQDDTLDDTYEEVGITNVIETPEEPSIQLTKPSEKLLDLFKGPRRYMLFDELIATIVDFDEDGTPIVEFSMMGSLQDEKLPVECGICPDVMHKSKLSKHQKTHLVPGTNRYACIYCTETYRDCKYLAGHARRHMGIRPYVCEPCKLYFSTKQDLRVHNQRRHLEKEHICEMCGKTFAQNTQLKRHREATHEKKRRFQCQYCQKAYYKNFSLQEHIRNVHMGKRRMLKCPFCGMQCRDAHKMARHRKEMHLNQDTYVCHLCQEEFTDINYFDAHKRSIQCRSNTRRLLPEDEVQEGEEVASVLEEDYDEDAGLLLLEEQPQVVEEHQEQQPIYETVNGNFLHMEHEEEAVEQQQEQEQEEQSFVQQYDQNTYEDDSLLVEQVTDDDEQLQHQQQLLDSDEQYLEHQQQLEQQQNPPRQQEFNEDELIYEITLETEDN